MFKEVIPMSENNKFTVQVEGMMCQHCEKRVQDAVLQVSGVTAAVASAQNKSVEITASGNVNKEEILKNITAAGYEAKL